LWGEKGRYTGDETMMSQRMMVVEEFLTLSKFERIREDVNPAVIHYNLWLIKNAEGD